MNPSPSPPPPPPRHRCKILRISSGSIIQIQRHSLFFPTLGTAIDPPTPLYHTTQRSDIENTGIPGHVYKLQTILRQTSVVKGN